VLARTNKLLVGHRRIDPSHIRRWAGALRNGDHSDRADVHFARPTIQIYDAHVVDVYQWVCARYLAGVKGGRNKGKALVGSRPNFRADHAGLPNPVPPRRSPGVSHRKTRIYLIFQYDMAERVSVNPH
jgi:hypothetical protein